MACSRSRHASAYVDGGRSELLIEGETQFSMGYNKFYNLFWINMFGTYNRSVCTSIESNN